MKEENLTPWFPAEVKPVHVGFYQASIFAHEEGPIMWWTGKEWEWVDEDGIASPASQDRFWRGLRSKP